MKYKTSEGGPVRVSRRAEDLAFAASQYLLKGEVVSYTSESIPKNIGKAIIAGLSAAGEFFGALTGGINAQTKSLLL